LELHHKTYVRLGRELMSDVEILCSAHHKDADRTRERQAKQRAESARYASGLNTFATKMGRQLGSLHRPRSGGRRVRPLARRKSRTDSIRQVGREWSATTPPTGFGARALLIYPFFRFFKVDSRLRDCLATRHAAPRACQCVASCVPY